MAIHFGYDPERKKLTEIESIGGEFLFELVLHERRKTFWMLAHHLLASSSKPNCFDLGLSRSAVHLP